MRFPEFEGEWEKTTLGNVLVKLENGMTYDTTNTDGFPISRIETISNKVIDYTKVGYTKKTDKLENYKMQKGDILFSHINSLKHIGKTAYYNGEYPLYHGMNLLLLRCKENTNSYFCFQLLNSAKFIYSCKILANQAVNQASVNTKSLKNIQISKPSIDEQQKIATFLKLVDVRISTQNKIIEELKKLKKGINNTIHKQLKVSRCTSFSEIGEDYSGLSGKCATDFGVGEPYITYLNVFNNDVIDDTIFEKVNINATEHQNVVKDGDVIFTLSSETPEEVGMGAVYLGTDSPLYLNSFCFGIHITKTDIVYPPYLSCLINTNQFRKSVFPLAQGSTRFNLQKNDFMKMKLVLPSLDEQILIYKTLKTIGIKLSKAEKLLDMYTKQKSYLLSNMFI